MAVVQKKVGLARWIAGMFHAWFIQRSLNAQKTFRQAAFRRWLATMTPDEAKSLTMEDFDTELRLQIEGQAIEDAYLRAEQAAEYWAEHSQNDGISDDDDECLDLATLA